MINRHLNEFMRAPYNIASGDQFAEFIDDNLTAGNYSIKGSGNGFEVKIEVDNSHFVRLQVGSNGFIVTAIPESDHTPSIMHPNTF